MTVWFVDASVLLAREDADDDQHEAACQLLAGGTPLATLDLAYYEVGNVAVRAWRDLSAAGRLRGLVEAIADDGGLVRVDEALILDAVRVAEKEGACPSTTPTRRTGPPGRCVGARWRALGRGLRHR